MAFCAFKIFRDNIWKMTPCWSPPKIWNFPFVLSLFFFKASLSWWWNDKWVFDALAISTSGTSHGIACKNVLCFVEIKKYVANVECDTISRTMFSNFNLRTFSHNRILSKIICVSNLFLLLLLRKNSLTQHECNRRKHKVQN